MPRFSADVALLVQFLGLFDKPWLQLCSFIVRGGALVIITTTRVCAELDDTINGVLHEISEENLCPF